MALAGRACASSANHCPPSVRLGQLGKVYTRYVWYGYGNACAVSKKKKLNLESRVSIVNEFKKKKCKLQ